MDVQNLRDTYPQLMTYLEDHDYSTTYVARFTRELKRILARGIPRRGLRMRMCIENMPRRRLLPIISGTSIRSSGPSSSLRSMVDFQTGADGMSSLPAGAYAVLAPEFRSIIDTYGVGARKEGKKLTTIDVESHSAAPFFLSLQRQGITALAHMTETAVLAIFLAPNDTLLRSGSYKKNGAAVLKAGLRDQGAASLRIRAFLPALRETRKNIPYLTAEEIAKVKAVLAPGDHALTLRDQAIGTLALYTGLRSCDIAGLTLDAIDWDRDILAIRQQKTQWPLELPLTATVGNALYAYLTSECPSTADRSVFLAQRKPYERLPPGSLGNIAAQIMDAAGIRQSPGDRQDLHLFRHYLATALLGHGVQLGPVGSLSGG